MVELRERKVAHHAPGDPLKSAMSGETKGTDEAMKR
jgi:hypothetical protein